MKVRPVLAKNCLACHSQSAMGGLRLDSRDGALKGGASGAAIAPGSASGSLLVRVIEHTHERLKMPPSGKLAEADIAAIRSWIDQGAYWPEETAKAQPKGGEYVITQEQRSFWSFQPVKKLALPEVHNAKWVRNPIDRFILARLEKEGLSPVAEADKRTLLRRATFDLTGLPPTPAGMNAFLQDKSPDAYAKALDRLLASKQYGERWARYWLDVARYSDDSLNSTKEEPYPNSFRYRNWVIRAFNDDMPYNLFVKAQLAGDLLGEKDPEKYTAGLGFYALSPEMQDERVDATTRGLLGLTVACATCHDHKFDPIPQKDFYSLQGVFSSTKKDEAPMAPADVVAAWKAAKALSDKHESALTKFYDEQTKQVGEMLAARTYDYLLAAQGIATAAGLDEETLGRWRKYLSDPAKDHPYLKNWSALAARKASGAEFQTEARKLHELVQTILEEKRDVDEKNFLILGRDAKRNDVARASLHSIERDKYIFWRDLFERSTQDAGGVRRTPDGMFYYGKDKVDRFLAGIWVSHLERLKRQAKEAKEKVPPQYPFLQTVADVEKPADVRVAIRGDRNNLGEIAPRRFLMVLSPAERKPFTKGSGRLELAEAIVDPTNPLTARVIVNRVWHHHFGRGIVASLSNFGQLGERPSHPELLDYLASDFMENGWSLKKLHKTIMLSATYRLSAKDAEPNRTRDPQNVLLWRSNVRRLDIEALRDSMLFASGQLDNSMGEMALPVEDEKNHKRTIYSFVSRRKVDGLLALFDFPNPNSTAEMRLSTNVPTQRLFFMNSPFVERQAEHLAKRLEGDDASRVGQAYRLLYARDPDETELQLGLEFLKHGSWPAYARVLLSSNEFIYIH